MSQQKGIMKVYACFITAFCCCVLARSPRADWSAKLVLQQVDAQSQSPGLDSAAVESGVHSESAAVDPSTLQSGARSESSTVGPDPTESSAVGPGKSSWPHSERYAQVTDRVIGAPVLRQSLQNTGTLHSQMPIATVLLHDSAVQLPRSQSPGSNSRTRLQPDSHGTVSVLVQYFRHPQTIQKSIPLFAELPEVLEVLVNDDSHDADWKPLGKILGDLSVPLIIKQSPNLNEIRGYNILAAMAKGEFIMTWQDDDVPIPGPWLSVGTGLLRSIESLVLLGSNMALSGSWPQSSKWWADSQRGVPYDVFFSPCNTSTGRRCIETYDPTGSYPFMYAAWLNLGPFLMYRKMFIEMGGFDEKLAPPGAAGMGLDEDLVFRMWHSGSTCGMFDVSRLARAGDAEARPKSRSMRRGRSVKNRAYAAEKVGGVAALMDFEQAAHKLNALLPRRSTR